MNAEKPSRRAFIGKAIAAIATALAIPELLLRPSRVFASDSNKVLGLHTVDLFQYPALGTVGGSVAITIPGTMVDYSDTVRLPIRLIVTRSSATAFIAEDGYCTHSFSALNPYDGSVIKCSNPNDGHGSQFALDGTVLKAPARKDLTQYTTSYDDVKGLVIISIPFLAVGQGSNTESSTVLFQNFPNPVRTITTIRFRLEYYSKVSLAVINVQGQTIAILTDGELPAGEHSFDFDASIWSSGTYLYQLNIEGRVLTKQMVVSK